MGPRSGWRSQPDPIPGTVDDHREADRLLQRYGGRAGGHLRYRRATPQQGTRPLVCLNEVGTAIGNANPRGHALPPMSESMDGRFARIVEARLVANPAREMVHCTLGRMALATAGSAAVEKGAALL